MAKSKQPTALFSYFKSEIIFCLKRYFRKSLGAYPLECRGELSENKYGNPVVFVDPRRFDTRVNGINKINGFTRGQVQRP